MKSIGVFLGSYIDSDKRYADSIITIGKHIVASELRLVYGGTSVGLMGLLADTVLSYGGEVTGVVPEKLVHRGAVHPGINNVIVTRTIDERNAVLLDNTDFFCGLPGGLGTLEELFSVIALARMGHHTKPCGILNLFGYYSFLKALLENMNKEKFLCDEYLKFIIFEEEFPVLLKKLMSYVPPLSSHWCHAPAVHAGVV